MKEEVTQARMSLKSQIDIQISGEHFNPPHSSEEAKEQELWEDFLKQLRVGDVAKIITLTPNYRFQKFIFAMLLFALHMKNSNNEIRLSWWEITRFDCCSRDTYQEKMRFCQDSGLITKVREFSRQENRARTFRVNYLFSEEGEYVNSLEDGVKRLLPLKEIKSRYSRRVYDKCFRG